ncbi:MAG TPA: glycoside hydrolase family 3 N-terminal domain-containing protein [Candidatus Limnocylindrales bacterium]|nr:glycoside hydrolase family 3 N-terminal domain-containing protein [Candidatus Limnocylindrales bacterium]
MAACAPARSPSAGPPSPSPSGTSGPIPSPRPTAGPTDGPGPTTSPGALRRKIGRMLMVGFRGTTLDEAPAIATALAAGELGGVILFDRDQLTATTGRNIASPAQLVALTSSLRTAALGGPIGPELLVAVDQEGGRVARLNPANGYPASQSQAELGAVNDLDHTTDVATLTAITLVGAGIDMNLAPVVDLNLNPANPAIGALDRSFSADPAVVIAQATALIEAQRGAGIRCVIKHFPGEGSATGNTDEGVVDVTATWTEVELEPFRALISAGLPAAVMVGHIRNDRLDPDRPASLSAPTVSGLLRGDLGWSGVVVSDDLQAPAITGAVGADEAIALAIEAGVDLLLFANQGVYDDAIVERAIAALLAFVESGRISEARLDESVDRIEAMFATVE